MNLNGNTLCEPRGMAVHKQNSNGMRVRDMIRRYNTALNSDSVKSSYTSIGPSKSSYFGMNANDAQLKEDVGPLFTKKEYVDPVRDESPSSSGSGKTIYSSKSPRVEAFNCDDVASLGTQKSFMNLSRSKEPPIAAPREKKARHSIALEPPHKDDKTNITDASYQSKTTISKTKSGVRIILDIFFDHNKSLAIDDIVGSRIETDIPPSKILKDFQNQIAEASQK